MKKDGPGGPSSLKFPPGNGGRATDGAGMLRRDSRGGDGPLRCMAVLGGSDSRKAKPGNAGAPSPQSGNRNLDCQRPGFADLDPIAKLPRTRPIVVAVHS